MSNEELIECLPIIIYLCILFLFYSIWAKLPRINDSVKII